MKTVLITLVFAFLLAGLAGVMFIYSGFYDVAASSSHSAFVEGILDTTVEASIARRAAQIKPPDLRQDSLILAGVSDFEAMCVGCHGAPGTEPTAVGQGLNPPAPDLQREAQHMTPAELFWVTKHGIKMTGMPAWGKTHDDEQLWSVVALMVRLPDLDPSSYRALVASASGKGHHGVQTQQEGTGDHQESAHTH